MKRFMKPYNKWIRTISTNYNGKEFNNNICPKCGKSSIIQSTYCPHCGKRLRKD